MIGIGFEKNWLEHPYQNYPVTPQPHPEPENNSDSECLELLCSLGFHCHCGIVMVKNKRSFFKVSVDVGTYDTVN